MLLRESPELICIMAFNFDIQCVFCKFIEWLNLMRVVMGQHLQILHRKIYKIRGLRVMLERGLAEMYKMLTKVAL